MKFILPTIALAGLVSLSSCGHTGSCSSCSGKADTDSSAKVEEAATSESYTVPDHQGVTFDTRFGAFHSYQRPQYY